MVLYAPPLILGRRAPVLIGTPTKATQNAGGSPTLALPTGWAVGDLLMCLCTIANGTNGTSMTAPTGWSTLYNMVPGGNLRRAGCFYKVADGSEVSMRPTSGNASEWSLIGLAIRGVREIPEVSAMVAATTAAPDPAAVSPSWGNKRAMFIAAVHTLHNSAVPVSALPAGYGNLTMCNNTGTAKGTVSFGNRIARTASEDPAAFTMVSSAVCVPATIALR